MTDVKICGLTTAGDVDLACALGASYVGFVFASGSPRRVALESAGELAAATHSGVRRVGVFVDEGYEEIASAIDAARLDLVQLHRPIRQEDLTRISAPLVAVARVAQGVAFPPETRLLEGCALLLFDSMDSGGLGGTGRCLDWEALAGQTFEVPLLLAGGLTAENVGDAIAVVHPAAVDVASGVERSPGVKDHDRMDRFFEAVRLADEAIGGKLDAARR